MITLTDEHYRAIAASVPGVTITAEALQTLDDIITAFERWRERRLRHSHIAKRQRWRRIEKATDALAAAWRDEKRHTFWADSDPLLPNRRLATLWNWKSETAARVAYYEIVASAFRGTKDADRDLMFRRLLQLWTSELGGQLGRSTTAGHPTGPLIRFLEAVVRPILGDETPKAEGFAEIIKAEQRRRQGRPPRRRHRHGGTGRKK